ncbi:MAG: porin family protein [Balneolales bacterium]
MQIRNVVIITIAFILIVAKSTYAQDTFSFGLKSGISSSSFYTSSDRTIEFNNRWGLSVGGFLDLQLAKVINLQPEINYTQRGSSVSFPLNADEEPNFLSIGQAQAQWKTSYIEIPLLLRVIFPYDVKFAPHMIFGPSLNFLRSTNISNSQNIVSRADIIHKFDLATTFGVGTSFKWFYPGEIFFDIRYMLGTTDIHGFYDVEFKNEGLSLNLGYRF